MTALLADLVDHAALLTAADDDLDALGDRLHDGVLQALVVARYACDATIRGADPSLAHDAVQQALVMLRREVWLLRPRGAGDLAGALADLSAQLAGAGRAGLDLDLDTAAADAVPPATAATAYRLVQALAGDRPLRVHLSRDGDVVLLTLGAGLPEPAPWHLRIRSLGGDLRVGPDRTTLLLPIPEDHP